MRRASRSDDQWSLRARAGSVVERRPPVTHPILLASRAIDEALKGVADTNPAFMSIDDKAEVIANEDGGECHKPGLTCGPS